MPIIQSKWGGWTIGDPEASASGHISGSSSVAALIAGADLALCDAAAGDALAQLVPVQAVQGGAEAQSEGERFVISGGIAQVPVRGILTKNSGFARYFGWATYDGLAATLEDLGERSDVSAIVLRVDSPGGQVLGVSQAVAALRAAREKKPVYAVCDGVVASAAYWLASQAQEISISRGSWVGSVGVLTTSSAPMAPSLIDGEQAFIITSKHAGAKRPDPSTEGGRALIQARADALEDEFLADVAQGRGIERAELVKRLSRSGEETAGGDVFWNEDAVARGLVDRIEDPQTALDRIAAAHGRKAPARRGSSAQAQAAAAQARAAL